METFSFYAVEMRWWFCRRTYRVFVNRHMIAGAYVAGWVRDEQSIWLELGQGNRVYNWLIRRRLPGLLARRSSARNCTTRSIRSARTSRSSIRSTFSSISVSCSAICFKHARTQSVWTSFAFLLLKQFDGTTRRLNVVGYLQPEQIIESLRLLDRNMEVEGQLRCPSPEQTGLWHARRDLFRAGICGVLLSATFLLLAYLRIVDFAHGLKASLCACFAVKLLIDAWKYPRTRLLSDERNQPA